VKITSQLLNKIVSNCQNIPQKSKQTCQNLGYWNYGNCVFLQCRLKPVDSLIIIFTSLKYVSDLIVIMMNFITSGQIQLITE